jgi:hypothetical protein
VDLPGQRRTAACPHQRCHSHAHHHRRDRQPLDRQPPTRGRGGRRVSLRRRCLGLRVSLPPAGRLLRSGMVGRTARAACCAPTASTTPAHPPSLPLLLFPRLPCPPSSACAPAASLRAFRTRSRLVSAIGYMSNPHRARPMAHSWGSGRIRPSLPITGRSLRRGTHATHNEGS